MYHVMSVKQYLFVVNPVVGYARFVKQCLAHRNTSNDTFQLMWAK